MSYFTNNLIRASVTVVSSGNVAFAPTSFQAVWKLGTTSYTAVTSLANPSTGVYYFDLAPATPGEYGVRWKGLNFESFDAFIINSDPFT